MEADLLKKSRVLAEKFLEFVNRSLSPFHVVHYCREKLLERGFKELIETENWKLEKPGKYFFTRNHSTLIAFDLGKDFDINDTAFKIVGAHTDSPCLRVAPNSKMLTADFHQLCVVTYGGGLWHTWFDRDLTIGGKVVIKNGDNYTSKIWTAKKPLLKVPNLAIHLTPASDKNKFEPNLENNLRPILASEIIRQLVNSETKEGKEAKEVKEVKECKQKKGIYKKHYSEFVDLIANDLGVNSDSILDFDLYITDATPSIFFGMNDEYISSPRLDNLYSSFHSLISLMESENKGKFINMVALFDHEEVGSESAQGAFSSIMPQTLERIYKLLSSESKNADNFERIIKRSFLISADMAHGWHPNYPEKHQQNHRTQMNKGIIIKTHHSQRYATDSVSATILRILAEKVNVPVQDFIVKNDSPCGSTIGPLLAGKTCIKTVDIGAAMLGMHSIRETCGVLDGLYYHNLFKSFFDNYENIHHDLLNG